MSSLLNTHLHTPLHPLAVCFLSFYCSLTLSLPPSPFLLSATYWNTTQHSFAFSLPLLSFSPRHFSPASCLNCNSLHLTFQLPYTNKRTEHFGRAWRSAVGGKRAFVRLRRTAINHCFFFFPAFFTQANSWRGGNLSLEQGTVPPRTHTHVPSPFYSSLSFILVQLTYGNGERFMKCVWVVAETNFCVVQEQIGLIYQRYRFILLCIASEYSCRINMCECLEEQLPGKWREVLKKTWRSASGIQCFFFVVFF